MKLPKAETIKRQENENGYCHVPPIYPPEFDIVFPAECTVPHVTRADIALALPEFGSDAELPPIHCIDCGVDLSQRTDWEPFVRTREHITFAGTSFELIHCRVCFKCIDICAQINFAEFYGETVNA